MRLEQGRGQWGRPEARRVCATLRTGSCAMRTAHCGTAYSEIAGRSQSAPRTAHGAPRRSMPELPPPRDNHRHAVFVTRRDHLGVAHRAAGLHDRASRPPRRPGPRRRGRGRRRRSRAPRPRCCGRTAAPCAPPGSSRPRATSGPRRCRSSAPRAPARSRCDFTLATARQANRRSRQLALASAGAWSPPPTAPRRRDAAAPAPAPARRRARACSRAPAATYGARPASTRRFFLRPRISTAPSANSGATMHSTNRLEIASAASSSTGTVKAITEPNADTGSHGERLAVRLHAPSRPPPARTAWCA